MARNRRIRNQNSTLQDRTPCAAMCEHLLDGGSGYGGTCMSGMYDCGSGPGGNCNCTNMGPVPWGNAYWTAPDSGMQMCSFSCNAFNQNNNYYSCMAGCGRQRWGNTGRSNTSQGGGTGRGLRRGGRIYENGGGVYVGSPSSCMDGMGNARPC